MIKIAILFTMLLPLASSAEGITVNAFAESGWGKTKNKTKSIQDRSIVTHSLGVSPQYDFGGWSGGFSAAYLFRNQLTEPREVSSTNLRGSGLNFSMAGKYQFSSFALHGQLDVWGRYSLSNKDPVGQDIKYKCFGFCGFGLAGSAPIWEKVEGLAGLKYRRWGKVDVNSRENDIGENRLSEWSLTVGLIYPFPI
jgi:hypothetical protein